MKIEANSINDEDRLKTHNESIMKCVVTELILKHDKQFMHIATNQLPSE